MNFKKMFSTVIGFGTIGLLSSVFAKIQGIFFPASMQLFNQVTWTSYDIIQLVIKLVCVYLSCIAGGIVISLCGGEKREQYITAISMVLIVIWLWISTVHPLWFWALLITGIIPFVLTGSKIKRIIR
ncbi:hypothetical protein [uncultured Chryseobacterium sp.]|uniref:hypothetical protein n=1 Tax=uncultured Chryseobacterium sp. TaxID=259322 RepID=UPI0025FBF5A5|nr:hypothetical protein [uncultured Chryseobacterium sp.]